MIPVNCIKCKHFEEMPYASDYPPVFISFPCCQINKHKMILDMQESECKFEAGENEMKKSIDRWLKKFERRMR